MKWASWFILLLFGTLVWAVADPPFPTKTVPIPYLGMPGPKIFDSVPPVASIYVEIKAWASLIGQVMSGLAGFGLILKTIKEIWGRLFGGKK
uniref:Uncharacterized protein n=1 Tax=viral metagenome TaxID=1070528 RepID=A0A6M3IU70_9ZZZZ